MENMDNGTTRQPNPRRKKRSPLQKFIKSYLPLLAVALAVILFIIFAIGSVNRSNKKREEARQESIALEESIAQERAELEAEAARLIAESEKYLASCEFDKAIAVLDSFSGNLYDFDNLVLAREAYEKGEDTLVAWEDPSTIPFLSFSKLVDGATAFSGNGGEDNRYYYISTAEFNAILQQLYEGGYMLVDLYDIFTTTQAEDGTTLIVTNDLRLPAGKKPIVLVHCQPDGYTNQLVSDGNGGFTSLVINEDGSTQAGSDFVPLLEDFIASHPGFSYKGARAVLAVTAHNGLFGYSLDQVNDIVSLVTALKDAGYTLASNTFGNVRYGKIDVLEMQDDLTKWETGVTPLLGETQVLAYARSSDISDGKEAYTSKKYEKLYMAGFRYYLGICYNSTPWMNIQDNTIRIGRIMVTGSNLKDSPKMFENLFDTTKVYGVQ